MIDSVCESIHCFYVHGKIVPARVAVCRIYIIDFGFWI